MKIIAVTSCPTGIAHTYMAAESLEQTARAAGHEIVVETQGAAGATPFTPAELAEADVVILAADVEVRGRERFASLPTVTSGVKRAINDAPALLAEAEAAAAARGAKSPAAAQPAPAAAAVGPGTRLRQWLMTGVSYMIPFVAAGGICIALGFLFGGDQVVDKLYGGTYHGHTWAAVAGNVPSSVDVAAILHQAGYAGLVFIIGKIAFFMLAPILSGFIAYAMADRQGLVPGIVGGLIASAVGAGFLGGLVSGLLAGAVVMAIGRLRIPRLLAGVMPVVVVPLVSSLVVGFVMLIVVGRPIAAATRGLTDGLNSLSGTNAVLLGGLLGLMMAFDMGGPVNKVAYTFGVASLANGNLNVMAAVMAAGMTPPIALALATVVRPKLFTDAERKAGEAAWLLGACFVTEGAIPFAAADPFRVIPPLMVGSAATGALSMAFGATSRAPHGGIFVVGLVGKPLLYLLAIVVGIVVSAAGVVLAKSTTRAVVVPVEESNAAVAPAALAA
ncbi:MAG TPA: fructose-specific PTS transporter subunit EIIC [Frankiaceae bacterium]